MTPEEIKSMQAYAAAAFGQSEEAAQDVIEIGNYVRIHEDADMGESQDLIYLQDIQAVGVVRGIGNNIDGFVHVEFECGIRSGTYTLYPGEVYLVDVDALHGEMEEMIAEETWQKAWNKYEANPTRDNAVDFIIANLRVTVNEAEAEIDAVTRLHESVVKTYEARLNEHKQALEESQARVKRLEETAKNARDTLLWTDTQTWQLSVWQAIQTLTEALPNVNAGSAANAGDESA